MEANEAANDRAKLADASGVCEHLLNMERDVGMRCLRKYSIHHRNAVGQNTRPRHLLFWNTHEV
jgi:hypothetical protein